MNDKCDEVVLETGDESKGEMLFGRAMTTFPVKKSYYTK